MKPFLSFIMITFAFFCASGVYAQDSWNIEQLGEVDTPGFTHFTDLYDTYACVADWTHGFKVVDIADPENPVIVGELDIQGWARYLTVHEHYAFIAAHSSGLRIVDLSDPYNPVEISNYPIPGECARVAVRDSIAYVVSHFTDEDFHIVDISDIENPQVISTFETNGLASDVQISGDFAFVPVRYEGLLIIDVSDQENPIEVSFTETLSNCAAVMLYNECALIAEWEDGLSIYNVADPENPTFVSVYEADGDAGMIDVQEDFAYVVGYWGSHLRVINISNPENPVETGFHDTLGNTSGVIAVGDYAYVADGYAGLKVFDCSNATNIEDPENLSLSIESWSDPTVIGPGGGWFRFHASVINNSESFSYFDAWTEVLLPNGDTFGPLFETDNIFIESGQELQANPFQWVPDFAPAGEYVFYAKVGSYPEATAVDSFDFVKIEDFGAPAHDNGWTATEWFENNSNYLSVNTPSGYNVESYPNPFNPTTTVTISVPESADIKLGVYDLLGRQVAVLAAGQVTAGYHQFTVDAGNWASGLYFVKFETPAQSFVRKMVLVK